MEWDEQLKLSELALGLCLLNLVPRCSDVTQCAPVLFNSGRYCLLCMTPYSRQLSHGSLTLPQWELPQIAACFDVLMSSLWTNTD